MCGCRCAQWRESVYMSGVGVRSGERVCACVGVGVRSGEREAT